MRHIEKNVVRFVETYPGCSVFDVSKRFDWHGDLWEMLGILAKLEDKKLIICTQLHDEEPRFQSAMVHQPRFNIWTTFLRGIRGAFQP